MITFKQQPGFTLVETLVAITVLVIAVVGPLYAVHRSLSASYTARDTLIATALAQEGMEFIRYRRDTNYLQDRSDWLFGLDTCMVVGAPGPNDHGCGVDFATVAVSACPSGGCTPLRLDTLYRYRQSTTAAWPATRFSRTVTIVEESATEAEVVVTVRWSTYRVPYSVTVREHMYDWQ